MPGTELYERWAAAMEYQNVSVDPWDDLSGTERVAWNRLADTLADGAQ